MKKKNQALDYDSPAAEITNVAAKQPKKKKKGSGLLGRIVRRFFLLLFTVIILALAALVLAANLVFNGPSPAAQEVLTMTLLEPSATKWIPALFIGEERVEEIRNGQDIALESDVTDTSQVIIRKDSAITSASNEWENYPDGIRIEEYKGDTFVAHIMLVRDPAQVYTGISNKNGFTTSVPGKRLTEAIEEEGAIAAVNAGAFNDDGTGGSYVGSCPQGLVYSEGKCVWTAGAPPKVSGFAGFNEDDVLIVHKENIGKDKAEELNIRDGCCFGPALIINGEINMEAYNNASGYNPRTAIGQRSDGAVIFVCIDGRQPGRMGGTYADVIDIMVEYGAVNACNMDGGSSSVMLYRDTYGRYGEAGQVQMINSYSLLQSQPRRMPNYWLVRAAQ